MPEVELMQDEAAAALKAALAIKSEALQAEEKAAKEAAKAEADAKAQAKKDAEEAAARKKNPGHFVGVEVEGGAVSYYPNASKANDRTIAVAGDRYEHTREDADGVWIYRCLDRK